MIWLFYSCFLFSLVGFSIVQAEAELSHDLLVFGGMYLSVVALRFCWHRFKLHGLAQELVPLLTGLLGAVAFGVSVSIRFVGLFSH